MRFLHDFLAGLFLKSRLDSQDLFYGELGFIIKTSPVVGTALPRSI